MADQAHDLTDRKLEEMERHLSAIYSRARKEIGKDWTQYMLDVQKQIKALQSEYDKALISGDKNAIKRAAARLAYAKKDKTLRNKRYKDLTAQYAQELLHVNETAIAYINGRLPEVYALNYNALDTSPVDGYSFTLVDADTVRNLATTEDSLMPIKHIDPAKDIPWNTKKVNAEVLQGILQGESMQKIADRLQKVETMNRASAIRAARTSVTGAENKGRQDSYTRAEDDGLKIKKVWMATLDGRTRHAHGLLDGQKAAVDKPFESELGPILYPGDPTAHPANVYNCRCTTIADVGQARGKSRVARDENGKSVLVENMSYAEWYQWRTGKPFVVAEKPEKKVVANGRTADLESINRSIGKIYEDRRIKENMGLSPYMEWKKSIITGSNINLEGVDDVVVKGISEQLESLSKRYYSTLQGVKVGEKKQFFKSSVFAHNAPITPTATSEIVLNPFKINDTDRIKELVKKGWAVSVKEGLENKYIITHEFAHSILNEGTLQKNYVGYSTRNAKKAHREIEKLFEEYKNDVKEAQKKFKEEELKFITMSDFDENAYKKAKSDLNNIKISEYALQNSEEFMAECFTQHEIGTRETVYSEKVMEVINKYFGR